MISRGEREMMISTGEPRERYDDIKIERVEMMYHEGRERDDIMGRERDDDITVEMRSIVNYVGPGEQR